MTKILVVDDLAVDRQFVGKLLEKDPQFEIEFAADGAEALRRIEESPPDLVVTDLMMPEVDGLELVEQTRNKHPLVPVILITSKGGEEIATQALRRGAASYVPKRELPGDLLGTVRRVLGVSARQRDLSRLMERLAWSDCEFVLENDSALFGPLVSYLQDALGHLGLCGDADRTRVGVALEEALCNALYHGNLEVGRRTIGLTTRWCKRECTSPPTASGGSASGRSSRPRRPCSSFATRGAASTPTRFPTPPPPKTSKGPAAAASC